MRPSPMPLKPETSARKKVAALERRKALLDALIAFIKAHPAISSEAWLHSLHGKTGLKFDEYALVVPEWVKDKPVLRLMKSGENWINKMNEDDYLRMNHTAASDISGLSDEQLDDLLERVAREANPDWEDEEEEEEKEEGE